MLLIRIGRYANVCSAPPMNRAVQDNGGNSGINFSEGTNADDFSYLIRVTMTPKWSDAVLIRISGSEKVMSGVTQM